MKRERVIFLGLLGVAGAGLMLDQAFFAPASASAGVSVLEQPEDLALTQGETGGSGTVQAGMAPTLRQTLGSLFGTMEPDEAPVVRLGPRPEWMNAGSAAQAPQGPRVSGQSDSSGVIWAGGVAPTVSLVMPTSSGGIAVIDGVRMSVGQTHPNGYRLLKVEARSVVLERDGRRSELRLPVPGE